MRSARRSLLLLAATLCALASLAPRAEARVGDKLESVKQTDFFQFFGLVEERERGKERGLAVVTFRPRADKFRELVRLRVWVNSDDVIRETELTLERSFVDDSVNSIFARDIAKSFLRSSVPAPDEPRVNDLANEIEFPKEMRGYKIMRARPDPALPAQPTAGYRVFLGESKLHEAVFAQSTLRMENLRAGEGGSLRMRVAAKWTPPRRRGPTA